MLRFCQGVRSVAKSVLATLDLAFAGHWQIAQKCSILQSQLFGRDLDHHSCHNGLVPNISDSAGMSCSCLAVPLRRETKSPCDWGPDL